MAIGLKVLYRNERDGTRSVSSAPVTKRKDISQRYDTRKHKRERERERGDEKFPDVDDNGLAWVEKSPLGTRNHSDMDVEEAQNGRHSRLGRS